MYKNKEIIKAYLTLTKLDSVLINDINEAYNIFKFKKQLKPCYDFIQQEQKKIIDKYHGNYDSLQNKISFLNQEDQRNASIELQNIYQLENNEINIVPIKIKLASIPNMILNIQDFENLQGYIIFEET